MLRSARFTSIGGLAYKTHAGTVVLWEGEREDHPGMPVFLIRTYDPGQDDTNVNEHTQQLGTLSYEAAMSLYNMLGKLLPQTFPKYEAHEAAVKSRLLELLRSRSHEPAPVP